MNIGLIGAGIGGGGVVKNLTRNADLLADRLGIRLNLKWVCDKDEVKLKSLPVPASFCSAMSGIEKAIERTAHFVRNLRS